MTIYWATKAIVNTLWVFFNLSMLVWMSARGIDGFDWAPAAIFIVMAFVSLHDAQSSMRNLRRRAEA